MSNEAKTVNVNEINDTDEVRKNIASVLPEFDVVLFHGDILNNVYPKWESMLRKLSASKREKIYVIISTHGGNPHEAFKMMQYLHHSYKKYIGVIVLGGCYSAGTLFAIGADEIFMSSGANLGPLDIQIRKEDDLERVSGECYRQALSDIGAIANNIYSQLFDKMKSRRDILISTQTASHAAGDIAKGLLAPIAQQIEPAKLGEMMRSQKIGISYGCRLMRRCYERNVAEDIATSLAREYPSHDTVIDVDEAKYLGLNVTLIDPASWCNGVFNALATKMLQDDYYDEPIISALNDLELPLNVDGLYAGR